MARLRAGLAIGAFLSVGALAGCKNTTEALPDLGRGYYPLAVGNTWTYAVRDSVWSAANLASLTSIPMATSFQLRETITEVFADAAGQPAYRLVRARRAAATANWVDDSVFTISAAGSALILNRGNTRTVELIFPPRTGRSWNLNAFNNNYNDTITDKPGSIVLLASCLRRAAVPPACRQSLTPTPSPRPIPVWRPKAACCGA